MKSIFVISLLLSFGCLLHGQDWEHYAPLESKGEVPGDFTEAYISKYEREKGQISEEAKRKTRKRQDDFYRKSEYFVDEYLVSGNVIFGDTISQYCEKILDLLLKDNPSLRKELRVYTVKSPIMNASATGNGIIFVNLGLLAEVENEAQLAYILAHEVIHYKEKHVINQYVEQEKISNGEDLYRQSDEDEKLLALSTYSKSLELEADEAGFRHFYEKSGYNHQAAMYVMDILLYSYLPFDEIEFDKAYLERGNFNIPRSYMLEEVSPITAQEEYDDSESSHPNIKTRRDNISKLIGKDESGALYQISEDWFGHCQRVARYEISRLYLSRLMYPEAIYNTYLLGKKYGEDRYQRLTVAKALHAASVYRNDFDLDDNLINWEDIEGQSQQVYHLFHEFEEEELNTMAVAYAYDLHRDYPDDEDVERIFRRCLYDLVFENELMPSDFIKQNPDTLEALVDTSAGIKRSSKISRIKKQKIEETESEDHYKSAFIGYWQDSLFTSPFDSFAKEAEEQDDNQRHFRPAHSEDDKYDKNKALGIDRVVCVTPIYLKLDERKEDGIRFITTDERLEKYRQQITDLAGYVNLDLELLDYKKLSDNQVETFNDISLLKNWVRERIAHGNTDAIVSDFDQVRYLRERYNTDYLCYTGNLSLRVSEGNVAYQIFYSLVLYPLLPFTIIDLANPDYKSFNFFFLFDLRNGNALLAEYNYYETKDSDDYIRSIIYNHLLQIKDKPKL